MPPFFCRSVSVRNKNLLPTKPGIYYLIQWTNPWKVLYIGKAANLRSRWSGNNHHKLKQAKKHLGTRIHYRKTWSKNRAKELEAIEQRKYNPPWNDRIESLAPTFATSIIQWNVSILISIVICLGFLQYWSTAKMKPRFPQGATKAQIDREPSQIQT